MTIFLLHAKYTFPFIERDTICPLLEQRIYDCISFLFLSKGARHERKQISIGLNKRDKEKV